MDRERAETYLRLLAEAELRRATAMAARSSSRRWPSARLELAGRALSAVGAVGAGVADQIQADVGLAVAVRHRLPARGPGPARIPLTSQRRPWRVVPVGQGDPDPGRRPPPRGACHGLCAVRGRRPAHRVGWPFRPFTAADDRGVRYLVSWQVGPAVTQLPLQPDPPRQIRWLDLSTAAGEPPTRIDLDRHIPVPDVTVTPAAHSPGELLLDVIAAPDSSPGCARRLGIDGHGITAPPDQDLPERWQSILTPLARREPRAPPPPGILAAAVAELPELDSAQITIIGLHHGERGTIMHLLVSGVTLEEEWAYARGVRPLPVLWIRDSDGRWHATDLAGVSPWGNTGVTMVSMRLIPPLDHGTTWIQIAATGPSAQVLATLPLSSQRPSR